HHLVGLFGRVFQRALGSGAQREIDRGRDTFANWMLLPDLLANRMDLCGRQQQTLGQVSTFTENAQQKMLGFNLWAVALARFVSGEKDSFAGCFCVSFEHSASPKHIANAAA